MRSCVRLEEYRPHYPAVYGGKTADYGAACFECDVAPPAGRAERHERIERQDGSPGRKPAFRLIGPGRKPCGEIGCRTLIERPENGLLPLQHMHDILVGKKSFEFRFAILRHICSKESADMVK